MADEEVIKIKPQRVYISIYINESGLVFEAVDSLDYSSKEATFLASVARGLVEFGLTRVDELVEAGTQAFISEGVLIRKPDPTELDDGTIVDFPETVGEA